MRSHTASLQCGETFLVGSLEKKKKESLHQWFCSYLCPVKTTEHHSPVAAFSSKVLFFVPLMMASDSSF